jgi:hypothetical protein
MSLSSLPTELRLHIWQLAYFSQAPRLVELRTLPHNNAHDETILCPRYSPSPSPTIVNICQEARKEALYHARKAGHIVRLHHGPLNLTPSQCPCTAEFFFRFKTDILYILLDDRHVAHFDDSPENGLLPHFLRATGCDGSRLHNIAITSVIRHGLYDGSVMNTLRGFPDIHRIYMVVPEDVHKEMFVSAASKIMTVYKFDRYLRKGQMASVEATFARVVKGNLEVVPLETWRTWSELGSDWSLKSYLDSDLLDMVEMVGGRSVIR